MKRVTVDDTRPYDQATWNLCPVCKSPEVDSEPTYAVGPWARRESCCLKCASFWTDEYYAYGKVHIVSPHTHVWGAWRTCRICGKEEEE